MPDSTLMETPMDKGGVLVLFSAVGMNLYNWISIENINSILVFFTTLFALGFMYFKFRNEHLTYRKKKDADRQDEAD